MTAVKRVNIIKEPNDRNNKVYVKQSKIKSGQKGIRVGKGLFINQDIEKGDVICYYGGNLLDKEDAKYESPLYLVEFEKGHLVLSGDSDFGDLGIFANSIHPLTKLPKQNARFDLNKKKAYDRVTGLDINRYGPNDRGYFPIIAKRDMVKDEEVIVNYKSSYWATLEKFKTKPKIVRSQSSIQRQIRAEKRRALLSS